MNPEDSLRRVIQGLINEAIDGEHFAFRLKHRFMDAYSTVDVQDKTRHFEYEFIRKPVDIVRNVDFPTSNIKSEVIKALKTRQAELEQAFDIVDTEEEREQIFEKIDKIENDILTVNSSPGMSQNKFAIRIYTGSIVWEVGAESFEKMMKAEPVSTGNEVWIVVEDNEINTIMLRNSKQSWHNIGQRGYISKIFKDANFLQGVPNKEEDISAWYIWWLQALKASEKPDNKRKRRRINEEKFSLIDVTSEKDEKIDGYWLQDHIGTLETAKKSAKGHIDANPSATNMRVAIVNQIRTTTPILHGIFRDLNKLDIVNGMDITKDIEEADVGDAYGVRYGNTTNNIENVFSGYDEVNKEFVPKNQISKRY